MVLLLLLLLGEGEKGRRGELSEGNGGWSRFFFPQLFSRKKRGGKGFFLSRQAHEYAGNIAS